MSIAAVLLPVFVLVALTFAQLFWMGCLRIAAVLRGHVKVADIALGQQNWPKHVTQVANSFHNQFQLPILFYVLTILALMTRLADFLFVVMAWIFVLSRLLHAYIHVTSNRVGLRLNMFSVGAIVLFLMWIIFAWRVLFST